MRPAFDPSDGPSAAVLDAAPHTMMVVDGEGRILFANARAERTYGHRDAKMAGTRLEALFTPDCRASVREDLTKLWATPISPDLPSDHALLTLDVTGKPLPIELSLGRIDAAGARMAVVVMRDVSEQELADERQSVVAAAALEARERLEAMLEFAPAFIVAVSKRGTIDFINRILPQYSKKDVIGSPWLLYFPPEAQAVMTEALRAVFETETTQNFQTSTAGPDGNAVWFATQIAPMRVGGQMVGAVLVAQDVTERKRGQDELLANRHMALLGTLAAGVAHEINTPIQFVGDSIEFLRGASRDLLALLDKLQTLRRAALAGAPLDAAVRDAAVAEEEADLPYLRENMPAAFDRCVDGLSRVTTIVRSLRDFAHPSEKQMAPADLNRAIQSTLTIATNEYRYLATLQTHFGDLPPVTCYINEISQAVLNIVVNAAHAIGDVVRGTERKGVITVRTWREGDSALISIGDTGGGIPEAIRPRIFDPFFTTKEVGKGTGQGLAIAWLTVKEHHGGALTFVTKMGEGTTFSIRLPLVSRVATA